MMKVIENAKQAKTTWDEKIDEKTKEKFRKYFHLRPATEYITIVSTHKRKYMKNIKCLRRLSAPRFPEAVQPGLPHRRPAGQHFL